MRASVAAEAAFAAVFPQEEHPAGSNVVPLRLSLLPRHLDIAARWVRAGGRMGLLDAAASGEGSQALIVWVRETPDPAYQVRAVRMDWVVTDHGTGRKLGAFRSFEQALHCIRPVFAPR